MWQPKAQNLWVGRPEGWKTIMLKNSKDIGLSGFPA